MPWDGSFASASKKTSASPVARHRCNRPEACCDTSRHVGHVLTCGLLCKGSNSLAVAMAVYVSAILSKFAWTGACPERADVSSFSSLSMLYALLCPQIPLP